MSIKVAIIGGAGRVGSTAAYALQLGRIVRQITLIDVNEDQAAGEALDLMHGSSLWADQTIESGPPTAASDAQVVCITAGSRRKPDESRLDLINRNVALFKSILESLRENQLRSDAIIFVVSNPVDVLTRLTIEQLGWPPSQTLGLGTVLDTTRFCSLIAAAKQLPPTQVSALILGEHGDSMTPIWSSSSVGGMPLTKLLSVHEQLQLLERTRQSGAEVIRRKGGAGYAVGIGIAQVIHAIVLDQQRIWPVSTQMQGQYGLKKVCLSIPTVIGRAGVVGYQALELWPKEIAGLQASARTLDATWSRLAEASS